MLARVQSFLLTGIDASPCEVEVDLDERDVKTSSTVVGLPDIAVRESVERVKSALVNCGYRAPGGRLVVNLAPADVRKEGPVYDLAMAVGLLVAQGVVGRESSGRGGAVSSSDPLDYRGLLFAGELALDGRLRPVRGVIAMTALAKQAGARGVVVPAENGAEAAVVDGIDVHPVRTLAEVVGLLRGDLAASPIAPVNVAELIESSTAEIDFAEVRGQEAAKRALTIAAAGGHNLFRLWASAELRGDPPRPWLGHNCLRL